MNKLVKYIIESKFNFNIDLLDLEDNEEEFSLSKQLYKSKSMKQEYIENNLFIDLGLPSGTKWCRYNLGCDFDLLASNTENTKPEDWYGKYYAWGEIKDKEEYSWETYKFEKTISSHEYDFVKYCTNPRYGYEEFTDNLAELLPEDDAAYLTNSSWRIPTKELCLELINYTNIRWISGNIRLISGEEDDLYMNVKGLAGSLFTSKINGNQLFIPAARYMDGSSLSSEGFRCDLWSSNLDTDYPNYAWYLYFNSGYIYISCDSRCYGQSVRPVLNKNN